MTEPIVRIRSLQDVRPGDLFLGPIGGLAGAGVRLGQLIVDGGWRVGPLDVRHIGVVTEASRTLPPGTIRQRAAGEYFEPNPSRYIEWQSKPNGEYDTYETGVITAPKMVQAMPSGAEEIELRMDTHWTPRCAFARIPEDYPGQAEDAAAIARAMIDIPYSWASYAALSAYRLGYDAPRLTNWINRRQEPIRVPNAYGRSGWGGSAGFVDVALPVEAICSVLADQAWSLAGKRVMLDTAPQAVTPSQLGQRLLFGMEGVVWGFGASHPLGKDFLLS
jgi:hypothetical protein